MLAGWRRFGHALFRPQCPLCKACRSLRIDVGRFRPNRSQRRAEGCESEIAVRIGEPRVSRSRLELSGRFHALRAETRGWRDREDDPLSFFTAFVANPFPTEEWSYLLDGELVGLGHVDALSVGLSAIYFVHDPAQNHRGLGTWNVLSPDRRGSASRTALMSTSDTGWPIACHWTTRPDSAHMRSWGTTVSGVTSTFSEGTR